MNAGRFAVAIGVVAAAAAGASSARAQSTFGDAAAITQFQRSVDSYAFQHRQVQRDLGEAADRDAMALGLHRARPDSTDGDIFTPIVAAAFRNRIGVAVRTPGCTIDVPAAWSSEVPRVGPLTLRTQPVPNCIASVLPRLPDELEYRIASVALVLLDTHANMVVDVLHGAVPAPQ